jgi:hypothetical protein
MSTDARPPRSDDDDPTWGPSSPSLNSDRDDAVSGIRNGFNKVVEGSTEAAGSAILLVFLLLLSVLGDDDNDDDESMTPEERSAEWDARAEPIQERFEEIDVDEDDVEDAIAWARSQE